MQDGFTNLCKKYGLIKNIILHKASPENRAFIEFEDKALVTDFFKLKIIIITSIYTILND